MLLCTTRRGSGAYFWCEAPGSTRCLNEERRPEGDPNAFTDQQGYIYYIVNTQK